MMKIPILILTLIVLMVLPAACAVSPSIPAAVTTPPVGTIPTGAETPIPIEVSPLPDGGTTVPLPVPSSEPQITPGGAMIPAVEKVIQNYASQNNLEVAAIKLISTQLVDWPDGCLGVVTPGMACIEVITPGYLILLDVNGTSVELHSTLSGDYFLVAPVGGSGGFPVK